MIDEDCIDIYDFNYDNLTIHYGCKEGKKGKFKIKIIDNKTNFIIHQELMDVSHGLRFWTNFGYCKNFIYDAVTVAFEVDGTKIFEQQYRFLLMKPHIANRHYHKIFHNMNTILNLDHRRNLRKHGLEASN